MEGERDWEEPGQREDVLGEEVRSFVSLQHRRRKQRLTKTLYRYNDDLSLEDAIHTALLTLKEGFEGVMDETTIELGIISTTPTEAGTSVVGHGTGLTGTPGFRKLTEEEVKECVLFSFHYFANPTILTLVSFPQLLAAVDTSFKQ
jgi:hypothetical protein